METTKIIVSTNPQMTIVIATITLILRENSKFIVPINRGCKQYVTVSLVTGIIIYSHKGSDWPYHIKIPSLFNFSWFFTTRDIFHHVTQINFYTCEGLIENEYKQIQCVSSINKS
jgi:hypothetical protein